MALLEKLEPLLLEKIWGGQKLKAYKNSLDFKNIGESWEVSTLKEGNSLINGEKLGSICSLNYVVKLIDTSENLSIQVHPKDDYAKINENSKGKTECWLILAAEEGAGIYLGLKEKVTKKEFKNALENGLRIDQYLNFFEVKVGDFFLVPAGTVHAIGKGITLCEVQQSSGITYRLWDWNRLGPDGKARELHIEKALDCMDFSYHNFKENLKNGRKNLYEKAGINRVLEHPDFKLDFFSFSRDELFNLKLSEKSSLILFNGNFQSNIKLAKFETAFSLEGGECNAELKGITQGFVVS